MFRRFFTFVFCLPRKEKKTRSDEGLTDKGGGTHGKETPEARRSGSSSDTLPSHAGHDGKALHEKTPGSTRETEESPPTAGSSTVKNSFLFVMSIASNAPVPWVKLVAQTLMDITVRYGEMKLNNKETEELADNIRAFLYIVASNAEHVRDPVIIDQFTKRVEAIKNDIPADSNAFIRFINVDDTHGKLARLREQLDGAVQLLQTSLQISLVKDMKEFKDWATVITANQDDGNVIREVLSVTIAAKGNVKMNTEGTGKVTMTTKDSSFKTEKAFTRRVQGATVNDSFSNSNINADDDVDLDASAVGRDRQW